MSCDIATGDEDGINAVTRAVAIYVWQHPNAADTVEGIQRWWLSRARLEEGADHVESALDVLTRRGVLVRRRLPDGRFIYAAGPRRISAAAVSKNP
jgi:hypothetical protein